MKTQKIQNIEFLRLIAIAAIILLHLTHTGPWLNDFFNGSPFYKKLQYVTRNGQKGVDFFFMLSGLFFYLGVVSTNIAVKWGDFLKKKIIRLWPVMAFGVLLAGVFALFGLLKFRYWDNIYCLLFLNGTALHRVTANIGVSWYCSAMLMHFILFLYLFKNFSAKTAWLIVAVGIYICYGIILQSQKFNIWGHSTTVGYIFTIGMMRAWGGIGLGMLIGLWYKTNADRIRQFTPSLVCKTGISIVEFVCLYFMINNLMLHKFAHYDQFMFIIVFVCLITTFICQKGYISQILNLGIFSFLSKYVYSIFITHKIILEVVQINIMQPYHQLFWKYPVGSLALLMAVIIVVGVLTYYLVEKPAAKYLTAKLCEKQQ